MQLIHYRTGIGMTMTESPRENCWNSYIDHFNYPIANIRPDNHPRALVHQHKVENSIVLVHGLTDSPYYMKALGEFFHTELGYNVYLPLLQCHGLRDPQGMESAQLEEWKRNVTFAISEASATQTRVSIGGLSTGGALSYLMAAKNTDVTGALYLFSAALDLADKGMIKSGDFKEAALRSKHIVDLTERSLGLLSRIGSIFSQSDDDGTSLIGKNRYKYKSLDLDGAHQLARLIEETDRITATLSNDNRFATPVFIAHSEVDDTVDIKALKQLEVLCEHPDALYFPASLNIGHAEVVLDEDIIPADVDNEQNRNPHFKKMIKRIAGFARSQSAIA